MKAKASRITLWVLVTAVLVSALGYGGYRGYRGWRQKRFVRQATEFMEKGQLRRAHLSLQRAIGANPEDIAALRMMATIVEREQSPEAMVWRQRIVDLQPDSMEDRLTLAKLAAAHRDFTVATNALAGVKEDDRKSAGFLNVAGVVASAMGRTKEAETLFLEAHRVLASDPSIRLNLAVVQMEGTNSESVASARQTLEELTRSSTDAGVRCKAYRELVRDAVRAGQTNAALTLVESLLGEKGAVFGDRLLRLDVLGGAGSNRVAELQAVRREATNSVATVGQMILWEMKRVYPARILEWVETLAPEYQTHPTIAMMTCDLRVALQDWAGLAKSLEGQNWGALEFMRHAFRSLASRRMNLNDGAGVEWGLALKQSGSELGSLNMLLRVAAQWRMTNEMREVLEMIVARYPGERWAFQMLAEHFYNEGMSRPLLSVLSRQLASNPDDAQLKNNVAMVALLLDAQELRPHELARQAFDTSPTNRAYLSSYAFSLNLQGRHEEALQIIERLSPDQRELPAIAGYYAIILKANGKLDLAKRYFDLAKAERMLPEERRLLDRAMAGLR